MLKRTSLVLAIGLGIASNHAVACGEFFGTSLLENRDVALTTLWDASFALEASRLTEPPEHLAWQDFTDEAGARIAPDEQSNLLRDRKSVV